MGSCSIYYPVHLLSPLLLTASTKDRIVSCCLVLLLTLSMMIYSISPYHIHHHYHHHKYRNPTTISTLSLMSYLISYISRCYTTPVNLAFIISYTSSSLSLTLSQITMQPHMSYLISSQSRLHHLIHTIIAITNPISNYNATSHVLFDLQSISPSSRAVLWCWQQSLRSVINHHQQVQHHNTTQRSIPSQHTFLAYCQHIL